MSDILTKLVKQEQELKEIIQMGSNDAEFIANAIMTAGYRKVDNEHTIIAVEMLGELKRNIAQDLFQELYDICFELADPESGSDEIKRCLTYDDILDYANGMGVTIDE